MRFASLDYDVLPGGATEAVIHAPAVIVILALMLSGDTPKQKQTEQKEAAAATSHQLA